MEKKNCIFKLYKCPKIGKILALREAITDTEKQT